MSSSLPAQLATSRSILEQALVEMHEADLSWIQPLPPDRGWMLAPDAIRVVTTLVRLLRPRHVIELGSGLSTRALIRACEANEEHCSITSLDHDPELGVIPVETIPHSALIEWKCSLAPLVARDFGGKLLPAYLFGERQLASSLPADLILIDGPPLALGGREGTLYQLLDRARPGTIVLLDDASRAAERAIVRRWLDNLDEAIEASYPEGFARGLAAIIVRQPVPSATLWDRKLEMTRRQIEKIVPVGGMFVLVDQNYWSEPFAGGRHDVPLVERDGVSWGPPESDDAAMTALRIHRDAGASHLVLLWTAYWWLESYQGFLSVLRTRHELVLENDRLLVFRL